MLDTIISFFLARMCKGQFCFVENILMALPTGKFKSLLLVFTIGLLLICVYLTNIPVGVVFKPLPWTQNTFRYMTGHLSPLDSGGSNNVSLRAIHSYSNQSIIQFTQATFTQNTTETFLNHINRTVERPQGTEYPTEDTLTENNNLYENDNLLEGGLQDFYGNDSTYVDDLPVRTFICDSYIKKIVFIKTHKTASTTIASIFERFGYQRELAYALPKNSHIFPSAKLFHREFVGSMNGFGKVNRDMLTNHARFNYAEMEAVVPGATFITILREPVSQFESQFGYFEMAQSLHISHVHNPLEQFFKYPQIYLHRNVHQWQQNKNGQIYDLGLDHEYHDSEAMVNTKILELDKELDFVMITEFLDESLVVIRKQLCWNFTDIAYISKAIRRPSHRYPVSQKLAAKIRKWNHADALLYDHFNRTLWRKIEEYGPDFERDLEYFHDLLNRTSEACIDHKRRNNKDKRVSKFVLKHKATSFCADILRGDVSYTGLIRSKMKHMYGFNEPSHLMHDGSKLPLMPSSRYNKLTNGRLPRTSGDFMRGRARIRPPIRRGPLMQRMIGVQKSKRT